MKNNAKESDLKLKENILNESVLRVNNDINSSEWLAVDENGLEVRVESNISIKQNDPASARLILTVHIFDENFLKNDKPFYCFVEMAFYFRDDIGEYTEEKPVAEKFGLNMISIAYPYIRAYVSTLSAVSGIEQIHLPTINAYETFKNNED